jgi:glycosyltransferase involved in cell wall biosynthesis
MENLPKRIALVYDRVNQWGGAERVLLALHGIFPGAPLFTSVYDRSKASWAAVFPRVIPSFVRRLPLVRDHHEFIPFLTPLAFETFNFEDYEAVISVASADAKGIITKPGTFHLCYCLTPTRYLYSHHEEYKKELGPVLEFISRPAFKYLKYWDGIACSRPDAYVAISKTVQKRIADYYQRDASVVYPPVDVDAFSSSSPIHHSLSPDYYLWVGRFVSYKHPEKVVRAFNRLQYPLVMVGSGRLNWGRGSPEAELKKIAGANITFKGQVPQKELVALYQNCRAFIFFHEEDFGITPVEAMAAGRPVIALNRGGATETVIPGKTGVLIEADSQRALEANSPTSDLPVNLLKYLIRSG